MKTLCTHFGVCRRVGGLVVAAAAMACSDGKEAAPPVTAVATPRPSRRRLRRPSPQRHRRTTPFRKPCGSRWTSRSRVTSTPWSSAASIRVGVTFNRTHYFIDKGQERGLTYQTLKLFEKI